MKEQIEKQAIEEIFDIITTDCDGKCVGCEFEDNEWCFTHHAAKAIYNAGYRKQEWISVDDRLPKEGLRVLVWLKGDNYTSIDTDRLSLKKWVRWGRYVTHWMPLPEAPKMKGGAE